MLATLLAAVLVGGSLQRVTGLGFAMVAGPFMVLVLGARQGVVMINLVGAASALLILTRVVRDVEWRRFALMAVASLCTTVPGALLLRDASDAALEVAVGGVVLVGMTVAMVADRLRSGRRWWTPGARLPAVVAGSLSGAGSVAAGIGGPPLAVYSVLDRWDPRAFAATLQPFFVVNATGAASAKLLMTDATLPHLQWWAWLLVAASVVVAVLVGDAVAKKVSRTAVRRVLVVLAYGGGLATMVRGILAL
ncbi:sulfite exporter TauE/SafE family protein [Xylanimonas oleitrophica]|uniref:Probable membrane transporter protein n=1 Tax=Xylanimonas oleitrophica TaxID=2607479 RepID=A0A2W5WL66_9MICO|nr:sulfite exporter TauE/SafE family protein [Xylanimonas oleitrophica]PZR52309.1 sulfite exporter TauE/SafE family protein [Xylanimonas oleitrophica]